MYLHRITNEVTRKHLTDNEIITHKHKLIY